MTNGINSSFYFQQDDRALLAARGFIIKKLPLPEQCLALVKQEKWAVIDQEFLSMNAPGGEIFEFINQIYPTQKIEQMLAIRDAQNDWEEDGIWHDDGSRHLAFSLSLTPHPETLQGGMLGLRKKDSQEVILIPTPQFGEAIIFLTGVHGYEHKIHRVEQGRRIIMVGWCL